MQTSGRCSVRRERAVFGSPNTISPLVGVVALDIVGVSTVSEHLVVLRRAGLVTFEEPSVQGEGAICGDAD